MRFLQIARGSSSELEYHLLLARDLRLLPAEDFSKARTRNLEVQRMLTALVQRVQSLRHHKSQAPELARS